MLYMKNNIQGQVNIKYFSVGMILLHIERLMMLFRLPFDYLEPRQRQSYVYTEQVSEMIVFTRSLLNKTSSMEVSSTLSYRAVLSIDDA